MGKLLIDVLNLEKEGLVGFTEIGEQVPLIKFGEGFTEEFDEEKRIKEACDIAVNAYTRIVEISKNREWRFDIYEKRI